jgi:predicted glycoside hydrolase/deacetylase ChbG (UPF0249 family)
VRRESEALGRLKLLVVNADDLGYDPEIDRGILEAHARGIVTSATVMVLTPFARAALAAAPATLGIGLHAVVSAALSRAEAEAELGAQLARFEDLRGAAPTHLDSHKHAHAAPAILAAFTAVAVERGLPVRAIDAPMRAALRAGGVVTADRFLGDAARRPAWTEEALVTALLTLEEGNDRAHGTSGVCAEPRPHLVRARARARARRALQPPCACGGGRGPGGAL